MCEKPPQKGRLFAFFGFYKGHEMQDRLCVGTASVISRNHPVSVASLGTFRAYRKCPVGRSADSGSRRRCLLPHRCWRCSPAARCFCSFSYTTPSAFRRPASLCRCLSCCCTRGGCARRRRSRRGSLYRRHCALRTSVSVCARRPWRIHAVNREFHLPQRYAAGELAYKMRFYILYTEAANDELMRHISRNAETLLRRAEGVMTFALCGDSLIVPPLYGDADTAAVRRYAGAIRMMRDLLRHPCAH